MDTSCLNLSMGAPIIQSLRRVTRLPLEIHLMVTDPDLFLNEFVEAGLIHDHFSARQGVEDDHMNVLCMGGRTIGPEVAWDLVETYLASEFSQAERHLRR